MVRGHTEPASCFDLSPLDETLLVSGAADAHVCLAGQMSYERIEHKRKRIINEDNEMKRRPRRPPRTRVVLRSFSIGRNSAGFWCSGCSCLL